MGARLIIQIGKGTPSITDLDPSTPTILGRSSTCQLVLFDKMASRTHAEIVRQNGHWILRDCGAMNGTRINGQMLEQPTPLQDGHEIAIGETRIRFSLVGNGPETVELKRDTDAGLQAAPTLRGDELSRTPLQQDELSAIYSFMTNSGDETVPRTIVRQALAIIRVQTSATVAGFLSLDPEETPPKIVLPELAQVDLHLSKHLTQRVQREGRSVWLGAERGDIHHSESLMPFQDAICIPLRAEKMALGALHVYKSGSRFTEREFRFCEVLGGCVAKSLQELRARRSLEAENLRLRQHAPATADEVLLGESRAMRKLREQIAKVAPRPTTVLITGESGVGKELVSLAVHRQSNCREGPLVVVNCAAIASTLPEAELFGHCKGAFTGADRDRPGFFSQADEGSLFLDELGELPPDCQGKLLRVLEGKGFRPVGATEEIFSEVRVIAATNRDLAKEVEEGRFRKDLFYRLGIPIHVPPLREHAEDIPALVDHFCRKLAIPYQRSVKLTPNALRRLQAYSWPGNVRQLWAVVENAVAMCGDLIDARDLRLTVESPKPTRPVADLNLKTVEAWAIREALAETQGNVSQTSRLLGITRETLLLKMKRHGIEKGF